jgi:hypothetical protein
MTMRLFPTALLGTALFLSTLAAPLPAGQATGVSIVNGGFEQPTVRNGTYQLFATGRSFPGWTVVGAPGNVAPISGTYTSNRLSFPSKNGKQWLDLTGLSNSATGVMQTVRTVRGRRYRLSFAVGNQVNPGGIYGAQSTVQVKVNARQILLARNSDGTGMNTQTWKSFTVTFRAASDSTIIEFVNRDPRSDNTNGLDAVALTRV